MLDPIALTIVIILTALVFDFINGFHDASNSIATIVATRVLKYKQAVLYAAFFNFVAFATMHVGVAKMIGTDLVQLDAIAPSVLLMALFAGIVWNLLTWWWGMPSSSSHTLLGGFAGAAFAHAIFTGHANPFEIFKLAGWFKVFLFIFVAPLFGAMLGGIIALITQAIQKVWPWDGWKRFYAGAQLVSSALLSFNHGANDAQKTAGIIAIALSLGGLAPSGDFTVPIWVLFMAHVVIGLGTWFGGWRITRTLGFRLTRLRPVDGFAAEGGAALSIGLATLLHIPVSTTLTTTGAVVGAGAAKKDARLKWQVFGKIASIWGVTMPVSFALGGALMWLWHSAGLQ
jgi:PiT family inorganic phosphate transporter